MIPYDAPMIVAVLRKLPPQSLAAATPRTFQTVPVTAITPVPVIRELIANERARRARDGK